MEVTQEKPVQETQKLGNQVPNSFEELNAMTGGKYSIPQQKVEEQAPVEEQKIEENPQLPIQENYHKTQPVMEEQKYQIPESEYIWNAPYLKKTQILPNYIFAQDFPTQQMLKEFSTKLRERSIRPEEYTKQVDVEDFVKYDRDELWKTTNDEFNKYVPPIERGCETAETGIKTSISPLQAKYYQEAANREYYDPLKKYAQIAEDEGEKIDKNPLNNHKLIQNNYFPMSRLVGSYWNKMDKESYFRNRYEKLSFDPSQRDSGYSTNLQGHIDFTMKCQDGSLPHPREDYKQTEYRNTYWKNKGFQYKVGPKPISNTALTLNIPHYN